MDYQLATIIVPAASAPQVRLLSSYTQPVDMVGAFEVGLSATGVAPATHFISTGFMPVPFLDAVRRPVRMYNTAKAAWEAKGEVFPMTRRRVRNRLNSCSIVLAGDVIPPGETVPVPQDPVVVGDALPETPEQTMARLGLQIVTGPEALEATP